MKASEVKWEVGKCYKVCNSVKLKTFQSKYD